MSNSALSPRSVEARAGQEAPPAAIRRKNGRPPGAVRWKGAELELRNAYCNGDLPIKVIAAEFNTDHSNVSRLARMHNWPRRFTAEAIANMTAARRLR